MVTAERVYASSAGIVHEIAHEIAVEKDRHKKIFPLSSSVQKFRIGNWHLEARFLLDILLKSACRESVLPAEYPAPRKKSAAT
jgi:hypothetical protein